MNDITTLRNILFETLGALRSKDNPMEIDRAKMINETAQTIINSAKVEVDFARATGNETTGFLGEQKERPKALSSTATGTLEHKGNVTTHRMRG